MTSLPIAPALLVAAIGCGLAGGVFFAFSTFVMPALARLPPSMGIAAMQSINVTAVTIPFMTLLFGTALLCLGLVVEALSNLEVSGRAWQIAGGLSYLIGSIGVTIVCNVPRNTGLAAVNPDSPEGARIWTGYLRTWTVWNHVRTLACTAAAAAFMLGRS
jgi:uncharacterized membrane protein